MKKTYRLEDLDCANCAAKMEEAIQKIEGVQDAKVDFMRQSLTIDANEAEMDAILKKVKKTIKKVEPDACLIV